MVDECSHQVDKVMLRSKQNVFLVINNSVTLPDNIKIIISVITVIIVDPAVIIVEAGCHSQ